MSPPVRCYDLSASARLGPQGYRDLAIIRDGIMNQVADKRKSNERYEVGHARSE